MFFQSEKHSASLEKRLFHLLFFRPKLLYFWYRTKFKKVGKKAMEVNHNKIFPLHSNLRKMRSSNKDRLTSKHLNGRNLVNSAVKVKVAWVQQDE